MALLEEARMNSMTKDEVINIIKKASDAFKIEVKRVWLRIETLKVVVLVSDNKDYTNFEVGVRGCLVGWNDYNFKPIKDLDVNIPDELCPDIRITCLEDNFDVYTNYQGGITVEL